MMIKIELTKNQAQLLLSILDEAYDNRSNMGCNDPYREEQDMFSQTERIAMQKKCREANGDYDIEFDDHLLNTDYVSFIRIVIEDQLPKEVILPG